MFTNMETISVIDAAKRQLKEAIKLFFEQRDSVAIHTLASASHEILNKLAKSEGIESFLKNLSRINKEDQEVYIKWINQWKIFFKHGHPNPKADINFPSEINVYFIHDCIHLYHKIIQDTFWEARVWLMWVGLKYPGLIKNGEFKTLIIEKIQPSADPDDFEPFFEILKEGNRGT